jgi:outer membrane protein assembly factor BamB
VYAVNATTGVQVWKFATAGAVASSPAVANGIVYVGSSDDNVYAINATTGVQVWKFATGGAVASSPAVSEDVVYVGSADKNLYAINAKTGVQMWKYTAAGTVGSPAVFNGTVYVGSADGSYNWINAYSGALIAKGSSSAAVVVNTPAVANGVVYYGNANGYVYGFYLVVVSVEEPWRAATGGAVTGALTVANGQVFVPSGDDNLYAYDLTGGGQVLSLPERPDPATLQPNYELKPSKSKL